MDSEGCVSLSCRHCGARFCGLCCKDCGRDADHHVNSECPFRIPAKGLYYSKEELTERHALYRKGLVGRFMSERIQRREDQREFFHMIQDDLRDVEMSLRFDDYL